MTANLQIPDLDPAGPIDPVNDLLVIRQGLADRKVTVAQISNINFGLYPVSSDPLQATDVFVIGKNDGLGGYDNFAITPQRIGFLSGTVSWFYQASAPLGWQIVAGTGDRVLATLGGSAAYQFSGQQGNWQQDDVSGIQGNGLTVTQIPNHQHWGQWGQNQSDTQPNYLRGNRSLPTGGNPRYGNAPILGIVGGAGDVPSHDAFGACDPHNHGAIWRPAAVVGIVCQKLD